MDPSSWPRVKGIVSEAIARPPSDRDAFVRERCGTDTALLAEVASLLAAIDQAGSFIEQPALQSALASHSRTFEPGSAFGAYTILEFVGAGGMGEVYRAHDATLNRDVALKLRPVVTLLGPDRVARVKREAQILAALNHANVAAIYGLEEAEGVHALVLELVEGTTLRDRIRAQPLPIAHALSVAKQVADALQAAHRRGIIHSDLKPANIMLRPDGAVKILDFGLARMLGTAEAATVEMSQASSPDVTGLRTGLVFGTASYMSPEQARGEAVDERTDIWAFGCVLYETLTGHAPFRGETVEAILADVRDREPDWHDLPAKTPAAVARLLRKCLEKNADRRPREVAEIRTALEQASATIAPSRFRQRRWLAAAVGGAGVLMFAIAGSLRSAAPAPEVRLKRLQIRLPNDGSLARPWSMPLGLGQLSMAIAPDGERLAYVLERDGVSRLYLHALDQPEAAEIPATERAYGPFFSPDSRWIGFFADNKLKKVAVAGGAPIVLCDATNPYGGSWGTDGTIVFSPQEGRRPARIHESGGVAVPIEVRNAIGSFRRPDLLADGRAAIVSNPMLGVGVLSLDTGEFSLLVPNAGGGRLVAGHLIFARPGKLLAVPYDPARRVTTGPEAVIVEGVRTESEGVSPHPQAVFSGEGTLVYAAGEAQGDKTTPVWVDRRGKAQPLGMPPGTYRTMSLSPDGRLLAIVIADSGNDLWVQDLERGTLTRRTTGAAPGVVHWTPDGERLVFGSRRDGQRMAYWVPKEGVREPMPFLAADGQPAVGSASPDGRVVATFTRHPETGMDLWLLPLQKGGEATPFLRTRFDELGPSFSPDGRWIAYVSDESGQYEVYVRPYPSRAGSWKVSTDGGEEPTWSRDGTELFYRNGRKWMAAAVTATQEFSTRAPVLLFEGHYANVGGRSYDVAADGRRFLVLQAAGTSPVTQLNIVLHWDQQLKDGSRRVVSTGQK